MLRCLNSSHCGNHGRYVLGSCVSTSNELIRSDALVLSILGAILHDLPSLRCIYLFIFILFGSIGLISNIFSLTTFIRERIRFTVCGVYLIIWSICGILMMMLFLTNILVIILRYDNYFTRFWVCHGYPYLFLVMSDISGLMSISIVIECILNRYYSFDRFRSRKCAVFISLTIFILVLILNFDKIFLQRFVRLPLNQYWFVINHSMAYLYRIIVCLIHLMCLIFIFLKIKQQKQNWYQKIFFYKDIVLPSIIIIVCLCPYIIVHYLLDSYITHSNKFHTRFRLVILLIAQLSQALTFFIYILPNKYYLKEFQQTWIYQILCGGCCCYNKQRQIQQFENIPKLWQRRTSLETVMTISALNDGLIDTEFYNKIKLEV